MTLVFVPAEKKPPAHTVPAYLPDNHAVITERWRYIRYRDGGKELYDRTAGKAEFRNVAGEAQYAALKKELAAYMPKKEAPERTASDFDFKTHTWKRK